MRNQNNTRQISRLLQRIINIILGASRVGKLVAFQAKITSALELKSKLAFKNKKRSD